jgi:hypothetical protein
MVVTRKPFSESHFVIPFLNVVETKYILTSDHYARMFSMLRICIKLKQGRCLPLHVFRFRTIRYVLISYSQATGRYGELSYVASGLEDINLK